MNTALKILLVDDCETDCLLTEHHLKQSELIAECARVTSLDELTAAIERYHWDVILSDYSVHNLSFSECLLFLQSRLPDTPVILLTGSIGEEKAVELLKLGVWDVVLKNNLARLVPAIEQSLSEAANRRARRSAEYRTKVQQEERLKIALTAARMGVWEWDPHTDAIFWSPELFDIFGVQQSNGTLESFTKLLHPSDAERVLSSARAAVANRSGYKDEFRIIRPDGNIAWISNFAKLEYDDAGSPLKMIGTAQDITGRKHQEEDIILREQLLNSFFSGATAGFALLDSNLCYVRINDTLADMNGIPAAEHIGKTIREIVPKVASTIEPIFEKVIATGEPIFNKEVTGETARYPGTRRHWVESFFPAKSSDGEVMGVGAIVVEVTALKQAQESVQAYSRELEETNNALKVLIKQRERDRKEIEEKVVANVRELVLPYVEMLRKKIASIPEAAAYLNVIEKNLEEIISSFSVALTSSRGNLTHTEIIIAGLIKEGKRDKEIAEALQLSIHTIKAHRRHIRKKLGLVGKDTNLRTFLSNFK